MKKKGLFVAANFIIGFPTETWEEIRKTIDFAEEIDVDYAKLFIAIPLRNTEMYDLAEKTNSIIKDTYDGETLWTVGGAIKSEHWSADDLTILRAYEWDRINFSNPKKLKKIADRMRISVDELNGVRRRTLDNAIKTISLRQSSNSDVMKSADVIEVVSQAYSNKA